MFGVKRRLGGGAHPDSAAMRFFETCDFLAILMGHLTQNDLDRGCGIGDNEVGACG